MENPKLPNSAVPVVILCGGKGRRMDDHSEFMPKPLIRIGGMPILWHVMKIYSSYGFRKFILCLGYKGNLIKQFFLDFEYLANDFTINLRSREPRIFSKNAQLEDWEITFVDTGQETQTGERLLKVKDLIQAPYFCLTYGDGVSNVNLNEVINQHLDLGKIATLTGINPSSPFGIIEAEQGIVRTFKEKPRLEGLINGGFFVFNKEIFDYLEGENVILEQEPLRNLSKGGQLGVYHHKDFWACMDTQKDVDTLSSLIDKSNAPWMMWDEKKFNNSESKLIT